jgi:hypothetical protein
MLYTFTAEASVIEKGKEKGYIDVKICISPISNINKKDYFVFECKSNYPADIKLVNFKNW